MWRRRRVSNDEWVPRFQAHPGFGIREFTPGERASGYTVAYRELPDDDRDDRFDQWLTEFLPAFIQSAGVTEISADFTDRRSYDRVRDLPDCTTGSGKSTTCKPTPDVISALLYGNGYFVMKSGSETVLEADGWEEIVVSELSDDLLTQFGQPII